MCGRFALRVDRDDILQQLPRDYGFDVDEWVDQEEYIPRYNIAPRTQAPVVRHRDADANDSLLIVQTMKWGLVPHWSKFEDKTLNTTNARSENLVEGGGMWGSLKGRKRCAIPCQGYYEWLTKGKEKLPHFTRRKDGRLLLMAGLYDSVVLEGDSTLWTFTIVTTDANKEFSWLHDRQPVFLTNHDAVMRWLDTSSHSWTPELSQMVQPYSDSSVPLDCYPVPKEVGKVGTESPTFIEPVSTRKDGIEAMFSNQKQEASSASSKSTTGSSARAKGKRKHEETTRDSNTTETSSQSTNTTKNKILLSPSPPGKRIKSDHGDDSNQPATVSA
ncbi:DUF159-domain-containing protein [Agrocybe pediades]|nr:DUF159-domain-containing protein [Agrocybe pediades]